MTWRELKNFINKSARQNSNFLDTIVNVYDFDTGDEHEIDVTELSCSDEEIEENSETNWVIYLSINHKEATDETKTKEAGID